MIRWRVVCEGGSDAGRDSAPLARVTPLSTSSPRSIAHGAVIVEGLLDADLLARFNAELDPLLAARSPTAGS